jgi:dipeptidyl aminopeptidase/acylaminoacyl peptidase
MCLVRVRVIGPVGACLLGLLALTAGTAAGEPVPIESFTRPDAIGNVVVSPSGNRLAALVVNADGRRRVAVMGLDPVSEGRIVGGFDDADVADVHWVNDDRLVFTAHEPGALVREGKGGLFAANHDATEPRQLISWRSSTVGMTESALAPRVLPYGWFLHTTLDDGSSDVFVYREVNDALGDPKEVLLARLNTRNGALASLSFGMPDGTRQWLLDAKNEPRIVSSYRNGRQRIHWRNPGAQGWTEVADFDPIVDAGLQPWYIDADGHAYVRARRNADTVGLYTFDPTARNVAAEPALRVTGFDLLGAPVRDTRTRRVLGLHFGASMPMTYWFDARLDQIQRSVDAALPAGRSNRLYCGRCETARFFVVHSISDRQPGEYHLFDREKAALSRIGASRPWIDEATQGRRSVHRVTTRDGLQMPVYVTHPAGAATDAALPAVVLVHGGPFVRGYDLGWDADAQFLASRGYRVLQPEFRGTEGYGFRLFRAGWKEWGHAMQHDLADAVQWAARERLIDPARVCVTGGSYGGYAALMAPISHPGVFRCAASFAGVTDIDLMYGIHWSDTSEAARRYSMPVLIGDRDKDAERLARASPLKRVAEIKVPVLLAHGALDRRVPIEHATAFVAAARRAKVDIETVYYNDEGHGFYKPANRADYLGRLERFLATSLEPKR